MKQRIKPKKGYTGLTVKKQRRNDPCSCGSGKKAKNCHGVKAEYFSREQIQNYNLNIENKDGKTESEI